jgi:predicted tellurium resistance membrane protein TerC
VNWFSDPEAWLALLTLTSLELVLGVDNIMLIAVLSSRLPAHQQVLARQVGLALAMLMRIVLLLSITWLTRLTTPWFTVLEKEISGRDLILIVGGLFLLAKGTREIHERLEAARSDALAARTATLGQILFQVVLLDVVFSLDSVITAIGMVEQVSVMVIAIVLSVLVMMVLATPIANFIEHHPTVKILALAFLLLVGVALMADGLGHHIPRGYIYFALAFSAGVEAINLKIRPHHTAR